MIVSWENPCDGTTYIYGEINGETDLRKVFRAIRREAAADGYSDWSK